MTDMPAAKKHTNKRGAPRTASGCVWKAQLSWILLFIRVSPRPSASFLIGTPKNTH